ncbi:hypothetical protein N7509_014218 [Penicillium cosmopolitanum]|uniref:HMA domain-containing protein n=1 Tax=Penicillium cosmopolitanum TaxID=1131564 RepID=A0A9W9S0E5_9EURO|nr:uncharacterized protein N7509_014218 [Penicillium cosmopolitanum]KAJ5369606.1 hypothetical protein N7509_014218 [Penicillium cosmopolitanum]
MSDHQYTFNISMSCGGCSGAVERVLKKLEVQCTSLLLFLTRAIVNQSSLLPGVKTFDVNLESQTAKITTEPSLSYDTVLATIKKTGKAVNSGEADGEKQAV